MSDPTIGIDLGTTYSAVATVEDGSPHLIPGRLGQRLTPSMVGFTPAGERVVGERARLLSETNPEDVAFAAKRFIGRRWTPDMAAAARQVVPYPVVGGPAGEVRLKIGGRTLPVTQISAMVLGELKLDAEAWFGRPVSKAVVTVPANFDDAQRKSTKEAGRIAGLEVVRILNEPTAAALAYGLVRKTEGRVLVFDLGGGTFDVSILELRQGVFEVMATGGDPHLGGEDFDHQIVQWLLAQLPSGQKELASKDRLSLQRLKVAAEKAKRQLTEALEAPVAVEDLGDHASSGKKIDLDTVLTRAFFEELAKPLSERCLRVVSEVLTAAKLAPRDIGEVLLVGGMTRVPLIRSLVSEFFAKLPHGGLNPDEVVALGAAIHANEVAGQGHKALLLDVAAHSLGVGILGGKVRKLIPKNSQIPTTAKERFVPAEHGQATVRIPIYEGESDYSDENHKLGELVLKELSVTERGQVPIEVTFEVGSDGTLSVRASDLTTGLAEAIRIESRTELSAAEEHHLKTEEAAYAKTQVVNLEEEWRAQFRRLLERSERMVRLLERSALENPSPEADQAVASVKSLIDSGKAALKSDDRKLIDEARAKLAKLVR